MKILSRLYEDAVSILVNKPWEDYFLLAGLSDRWIPCMVISLLKDVKRNEIQAKRQAVFTSLEEKGILSEPIGFNAYTPSDCDSTAWLAHCCLSMGISPDQKILDFIESHRVTAYSYSTYKIEDNIASYIGQPTSAMKGWFDSHDCVSANIMGLYPDQIPLFISGRRFKPYWWASAFVPLSFCDDLVADLVFKKQYVPIISCARNQNLQRAHLLDRILEHIFRLRYCIGVDICDFPEIVKLDQLGCLLQLPPPQLSTNRLDQYDEWKYDGFKQQARVYDINSILTSAILVRLLDSIIDCQAT